MWVQAINKRYEMPEKSVYAQFTYRANMITLCNGSKLFLPAASTFRLCVNSIVLDNHGLGVFLDFIVIVFDQAASNWCDLKQNAVGEKPTAQLKVLHIHTHSHIQVAKFTNLYWQLKYWIWFFRSVFFFDLCLILINC